MAKLVDDKSMELAQTVKAQIEKTLLGQVCEFYYNCFNFLITYLSNLPMVVALVN